MYETLVSGTEKVFIIFCQIISENERSKFHDLYDMLLYIIAILDKWIISQEEV